MVHQQAATIVKPGKRTFHDPTLGDGYERLELLRQILGYLDHGVKLAFYPNAERFGHVSTVSINSLEMTAPEEFGEANSDFSPSPQIVNVGRRDGNGHRQPKCVNDNMPLAGSQSFENPLRRMSLFGRRCVVGLQDRVDDRNQRSELRPLRSLGPYFEKVRPRKWPGFTPPRATALCRRSVACYCSAAYTIAISAIGLIETHA